MINHQIITQKVQPRHTKLLAYVYPRVSSARQVRESIGSITVQMAVKDLPLSYGFAPDKIITITEDLGRSATAPQGRAGFRNMLADITLGRVGAVFCWRSSRLARSSRENYQLVLCCEIAGTLIIDPMGVYDPRNDNDRLFLGLQGLIDEADGRRIRSMAMETKLAKAKEGVLHIGLPTGFIWSSRDKDAKIILEPNELVRRAIRDAFDVFRQSSSALMAIRHYNKNYGLFPTYIRCGTRKGQYEWKPLSYEKLLQVLHHPIYAGSYVYGRYAVRKEMVMKDAPEVRQRLVRLEPEEWKVHIRGHHVGYISWNQYLSNQQKLNDNIYRSDGSKRGAPRTGAALLQGTVICGNCKSKMQTRYATGKIAYYYECSQHSRRFGPISCQNIPALSVDEFIARQLLQAFEPAQLEVSLKAVGKIIKLTRGQQARWQQRLQQAKFEAEQAEDRFNLVNPRNRLVADNLEDEWERKLSELNRLSDEYERAMNSLPSPMDAAEMDHLRALSQDLPALWTAPEMPQERRKQLLRAVIESVVLRRSDSTVSVTTNWKTGVSTTYSVKLIRTRDHLRTDPAVLAVIREMSLTHTDREIAIHLNKQGFKPRRQGSFNRKLVSGIRRDHFIPTLVPERVIKDRSTSVNQRRADGRYSTTAAARILGVDRSTVAKRCREGLLDAVQYGVQGVWWIRLPESNGIGSEQCHQLTPPLKTKASQIQ